ncbi:unnamed protein product [Sphacelaria rigidula]
MASKGPNTNKSQFFITYTRQPHLNNVYTVFGKYPYIIMMHLLSPVDRHPLYTVKLLLCCHVFPLQLIDGLDVLDSMEKVPVGKKERPVTDILIKGVTIHANPIAEND